MTGKQAWCVLIGFIIAVDLTALRSGRPTMSEALDDTRATHPAINAAVLTTIGVTAAHLARTLPPGLDPFRLAGLAR